MGVQVLKLDTHHIQHLDTQQIREVAIVLLGLQLYPWLPITAT